MADWKNVGKIQGEKGEKGDKGERGPKGDKGNDAVLESTETSVTFEDGTRIIRGTANLEYNSDTLLRAEINYPTFTGQPTFVHALRTMSASMRSKVKFAYTSTVGTNHAILYIVGEGFEEGNSLEMHYMVMGRV